MKGAFFLTLRDIYRLSLALAGESYESSGIKDLTANAPTLLSSVLREYSKYSKLMGGGVFAGDTVKLDEEFMLKDCLSDVVAYELAAHFTADCSDGLSEKLSAKAAVILDDILKASTSVGEIKEVYL